MPKPVQVSTPSDREVVVTRCSTCRASTRPELLKRWLLGPPGWSMPYGTVDLRVGGRYRYVWRNDADGAQFGSFEERKVG